MAIEANHRLPLVCNQSCLTVSRPLKEERKKLRNVALLTEVHIHFSGELRVNFDIQT